LRRREGGRVSAAFSCTPRNERVGLGGDISRKGRGGGNTALVALAAFDGFDALARLAAFDALAALGGTENSNFKI